MADSSPRLRVAAACEALGLEEVVGRCNAVLRGGVDDTELILVLGGAAARRLLADGVRENQGYWLRVWALRGLLWAGPGEASGGLLSALKDESWRVREMACKVVARHSLEDLFEPVAELETDPVARVRQQAKRALRSIIGTAT